MNQENIRNLIESIDGEEKINFLVEGEKASNRFDHDKAKELEPVSEDTLSAYHLYALIVDSVFLKAKRKSEAEGGVLLLESYFRKIQNMAEKDDLTDVSGQVARACSVMKDFIYGKRVVEITQLLDSFFPLIIQMDSVSEGFFDKRRYQLLTKYRERIINMALLSVRSLFRCFLTVIPTIEDREFRIDEGDVVNGLFIYQNTLFVPTMRNAFSFKDYKTVLLEGLDRASSSFSSFDIKKAAVIYLVKDTIGFVSL